MSVKIHGIPFQVNLCETRLSTPNMGEILVDQQEINIQTDMPHDRQECTLVHEILHGLLDGEDVEEPFVRRLANALYLFLIDNDLLKDGWFERALDESVVHRRPASPPVAAKDK